MLYNGPQANILLRLSVNVTFAPENGLAGSASIAGMNNIGI